jgi:gamma-glutamyl hercynylcysteine S-oxide synthase
LTVAAKESTAGASLPLRHRLHTARCRTDELFELLQPTALYVRPVAERHRVIFYLGHVEAFDWNLLQGLMPANAPRRPEFDRLFAFGIDPESTGLPNDQESDWPAAAEVRAYRNQVRAQIDQALEQVSADNLDTLLNVAIEHRLMHAETLSYLLHQLPHDQKIFPVRSEPVPPAVPVRSEMIRIPAGIATLGATSLSGGFGWDNEFQACSTLVREFEIDRFMVTNGEFARFISDGGYSNAEFWTAESWEWKSSGNMEHPIFWARGPEGWRYRTMLDEITLPEDWPVYVSHHEASAYARWVRKSLATEAEWHRAAYGAPEGPERSFPWGGESPAERDGNFDFRNWNPVPVSDHQKNASAFGVAGLLGNGWEWTSTPFAPLPEFKAFPFYPGYSADFFDGKHYVMKGGSARTAACMLRRSFRNWFRPEYRYAYAGFRCVNR